MVAQSTSRAKRTPSPTSRIKRLTPMPGLNDRPSSGAGMQRGFKVPLYPVLPILSIVSSLYLIWNLNPRTFELFGVWLVFAAIFYFLYSVKKSRLEPKARISKS